MLPAKTSQLVRSAADPKQVDNARRIERRRAVQLRGDVIAVMNTEQGRRLLGAILRTCGVYRSVWENSARIHYNAGRQDVGHELMADFVEAAPELFDLMEREHRLAQKREADEVTAVATSRDAGTQEEDRG